MPASRGSSGVHPARSTSHSLLLFPGRKFLLLQFFIYVIAQSCYLFSCCSSFYTWSKKGGLIWLSVCNFIMPLQFLIWGLLYRRDSLDTGYRNDSKSSMCQHPKSYVRIKGDYLMCWRKENGQREGEDIVEKYSLDRKFHVLRQGGKHQHAWWGNYHEFSRTEGQRCLLMFQKTPKGQSDVLREIAENVSHVRRCWGYDLSHVPFWAKIISIKQFTENNSHVATDTVFPASFYPPSNKEELIRKPHFSDGTGTQHTSDWDLNPQSLT